MSNDTKQRVVGVVTPVAFRPNDAAAFLGISRAKLYREIQDGRLRKLKAGARTLIARADAEAWLSALCAA